MAQLADQGMRGMTHRLVEQRAGQAQGAVRHHFGSLDGLITAVVEHMVDVDLPLVLAPSSDDSADVPSLVVQAQAVMEMVWSRPDLLRARMELYVHAARRPELQEIVARGRQRFVDQISASLPGPDAELAARFVAATMDGLILDQLSAPSDLVANYAGSLVVHAGHTGRVLAARTLTEPGTKGEQ